MSFWPYFLKSWEVSLLLEHLQFQRILLWQIQSPKLFHEKEGSDQMIIDIQKFLFDKKKIWERISWDSES